MATTITAPPTGSRPFAVRYACAECGAHKLVHTAAAGCCDNCGALELIPISARRLTVHEAQTA